MRKITNKGKTTLPIDSKSRVSGWPFMTFDLTLIFLHTFSLFNRLQDQTLLLPWLTGLNAFCRNVSFKVLMCVMFNSEQIMGNFSVLTFVKQV